MKKVKKIPMRKCLGCGESKPKKELLRIVKNKEGEIFIDTEGRANGRGAYICFDSKCLERANKSKGLQRAFGQSVDKEIIDSLEESIKHMQEP
ncbi:YlxR family protein [Peptoniphilus sp. GNH]|nr:hypothetical protein HMPREF3189_00537 [Clostridiales bacterium KA00134]UHR02919.1 YlxR family protein [Peptoniphilus sp. GNH]